MYIKDSSFYEEFRDATEAKLYLLRPSYKPFSLSIISGTGFLIGDDVGRIGESVLSIPSGIFERNPPLLYSFGNEALEFEAKGYVDDFLDSTISSGAWRAYFLVVYSVDENGKVLAPPGVDRVTLIPTYTTGTGIIWGINFKIPASESGFSIESIHLCYAVPVDPADISSISQREKNDIILSSIPYHNLEVELFDANRRYADFIESAGNKLRVLLHFQYNQAHSESFLYYYDERPKFDKRTAVPKTMVKFAGLTDILAKKVYVNSASRYDSNLSLPIKEYLDDIAEAFRNGHVPYWLDKTEITTPYGGQFLKVESFDNYGAFGIIEDNELTMQDKYEHFTQSPADGYSFADAFRLLINAQCHGMRVLNETIRAGKMERVIRESGAVFTEDEYYSIPQKTVYDEIDQIHVSTYGWRAADEAVSLAPYNFAFRDGGTGYYVRSTLWVAQQYRFEKIFSDDITIEWSQGNPFSIVPDAISSSGSSGITLMWEKSKWENAGYAPFTVSGTPLEKYDGPVYSKKFGNGTSILEISNPFLRPNMSQNSLNDTYDIANEYIDFNYKYQSGKTIYTLETRGRFDVHPLDRVQFIDDNGDLRSGVVIEHDMKYNGAMRSTFRVVDDGPAPNLYAGEAVTCSKTLLCREEK